MKSVARMLKRAERADKLVADKISWVLPEQLIGVEIELDCKAHDNIIFPAPDDTLWRTTRDGSLIRGTEFVLAHPMAGDQLAVAVNNFFKAGGRWERTVTSSTHIHVDMMEKETPATSIQSLVLLVYMTENAIFREVADGREWCGYTNSLASAPDYFIQSVLGCNIEEDSRTMQAALSDSSGLGRYYGLNLLALTKYGSIEFRYFPTVMSREELISWINMVQSYKKAAIDHPTMPDIEKIVSSEDAYQEFITTYFAEWREMFLKSAPFYYVRRMYDNAVALYNASKARTGIKNFYDQDKIIASTKYKKFFGEATTKVTPRNEIYSTNVFEDVEISASDTPLRTAPVPPAVRPTRARRSPTNPFPADQQTYYVPDNANSRTSYQDLISLSDMYREALERITNINVNPSIGAASDTADAINELRAYGEWDVAQPTENSATSNTSSSGEQS